MKIKLTSILFAIVVSFALVSCSSIKYNVDLDGSADFPSFKTYQFYGWAEESNKILNTIDQERVESAFGRELDKRGMKYVEEGGDLVVTLYIITEEKTSKSATTTNMGGGYGYGYGGYYGYGPSYGWGGAGMGGSSHTTYSEYDYTVGTLIIDIYDAKDKKLIWESISKGTLKEKTKGREERINSTVSKMMIKYPVEPIK